MGELIALLFLSREVAHRSHLKASGKGSYAAHMALNDFYTAIVDHADAIAEAWQGKYGKLLDIPYLTANNVGAPIAGVLRSHMDKLVLARYTAEPKDSAAIQNLIDGAVNEYQKVLYKLKFLE